MMCILFCVLVCLQSFIGPTLSTGFQKELICEGKRQWKFKLIDSKVLTCMILQAEVGSKNFTMKTLKDDLVHGISFRNNTKVSFLPEKVFGKFPNLLMYDAQGCSISFVDKDNFEKLFKLTAVDLSHNLIDHIPKDLFADSSDIQIIDMSKWIILQVMKPSLLLHKPYYMKYFNCRKQQDNVDTSGLISKQKVSL